MPAASANSQTPSTTQTVVRLIRGWKRARMIDKIIPAHRTGIRRPSIDLDQTKSGVDYGMRSYPATVMSKTADPGARASHEDRMTIGRLAKAAGVGVETIRYYQGRGLLPVPKAAVGFRQYPASMVQRIGFIKRAQGLGFSLDEVASLLDLEDGRNRRAIQAVTRCRLEQIDDKLGDLRRMQSVLRNLLEECEVTGRASPCPIIAALMHPATPSPDASSG